ncbi:metallophosphoesterase [Chroococcus sp. FPU101]|nr:metallophosphoesterase [Chroococcus sp. FPU101]
MGLATLARRVNSQTGLQAPPKGDVRIVVISDLNSQYGSTTYESEVTNAIALIPTLKPNLVLCGGDMIAGQKKTLTKNQINDMWTAFDHHIAAPLRKAKIPFGFTIGNHDGSGSISQGQYIFQAERELATAYWKNPTHQPRLNFIDRSGFPFYYTFTQNQIFYLVWDASSNIISAQQLAWVKKSLGSRIAQQAKMRIAIGHLPLYGISIGRDKVGEFLDNAEQLRSLLEQYQVHTYISGHAHAYYPGKRGQLELLHAGALGSGARKLLNSNLPPTKTLTVVDIDFGTEKTIYTTYNMKTLEIINIQSLPRFIMAPNGKVFRRDLQAKQLG